MKPVYYLAVDIGASSGRHILASMDNGRMVLEEVYRFENGMVNTGGKKLWDVDKLYENILEGMKDSKTPYVVVENRKEAITWALHNAQKDDIILLAGKGHETYQILPTGTIHFDEREVVAEVLNS